MKTVLIEGYTIEEILTLSSEEVGALIFTNNPIVFQVGSSEVLGQFRLLPGRLQIELAQIDGGGEGVLLTLWRLTERFALLRRLTEVECIVHAVNCMQPNLKLQRVLQKRGFTIRDIPDLGEVYYYLHSL